VLELCEQFRCSKVKRHLLNSLKLRAQTSATSGASHQALGDLLLTLVHCHDSPDPPQSLLTACITLDNPIFTVFAACYEPSSALLCICTWLATTLDRQQPGYLTAGRMSWSSSQVEGLIVGAVSCGRGLTLARAWSIFMPDHALCLLFNSLVKCVVMKNFTDSVIDLKTFLAACLNLRNNNHIMEGEGEESFLNNCHWVMKVSMSTVNAALIHNFSSLQHRLQFLNALSMAQFPGSDYKLLHQVVMCLLDIDVTEADSEEERHQLLTLALDWYQRSEEANICEQEKLELLTWQSWLRLDTEVQVPSHSHVSSVVSLLP
ncbi:unnamed protein product, partial [Timema podura]|nr:unnamed protein product [Timema podura]